MYCSLQSMDVFYSKLMLSQLGLFFLLMMCTAPIAFLIVRIIQIVSRKLRKMNLLLNMDEEENYDLNSIENGILLLVKSNEEKEKENCELKKHALSEIF